MRLRRHHFRQARQDRYFLPKLEILETRTLLSFDSPIITPVNGVNPPGLAVADFNRDGFLDVATVSPESGTVSILLGKGNGSFQPARVMPVGGDPFQIVVADFNGDGVADFAVNNAGSDTIGIWLGNGDGTFRAASAISANAGRIAAVDVNHDGKPDLVFGNNRDVTVHLSNWRS